MTDKPHYVILSVDAMPDTSSSDHCLQAPTIGEWVQTEDDDSFEFNYLGPEYENGRHRKWVAQLSEDEFRAWMDHECWSRDDGEPTMGAITEFGWLPAYALNDEPMSWNIGGVTQVIARQAYVSEYGLAGVDEIPENARAALIALYGLKEVES